MKRFIVAIAIVIAMFVTSSLVTPAHAQPRHADSVTCSPCLSFLFWNAGTAPGGQVTFYIENRRFLGGDSFLREFSMQSTDFHGDLLDTGVLYNMSFLGCTDSSGNGTFFLIERAWNSSVNYTYCFGASVTGTTLQFYVQPNVNLRDIDFGVACAGGICQRKATITNVYNNLKHSELGQGEQLSATIVGTYNSTSYYTYNEWWCSGCSIHWQYQTNSGLFAGNNNPTGPIQMYWNPRPNGLSNHGGSLEVCAKDNGSSTC